MGDVSITALVETEVRFAADAFLQGAAAADVLAMGWAREHFLTPAGDLRLAIQAMLVEADGLKILVDTCLGNGKERGGGLGHQLSSDFLERLGASGFGPGDVDIVLCTHLHVDHVGWNCRWSDGRWVPTFPSARYLIGRTEYEHWAGSPNARAEAILGDSIAPLFDAGLVDLVPADHVICDQVRLVPTPGHTPGHVSVWIESRGARACITGDILHSPVQIARPEWSSAVDHCAQGARAIREAMLKRVHAAGALLIGTHFPSPTAGFTVEHEGGLAFSAIPESARGAATWTGSAPGNPGSPADG